LQISPAPTQADKQETPFLLNFGTAPAQTPTLAPMQLRFQVDGEQLQQATPHTTNAASIKDAEAFEGMTPISDIIDNYLHSPAPMHGSE